MLEWLISQALHGLVYLFTKTLFKPMLWSGQQIRCAREEIRALDIKLYNAQVQSPGAAPSPQFFRYRRKQLWIVVVHIASWLILMSFTLLWLRGLPGLGGASLIAGLVVVGYFNVQVSGMPTRLEFKRNS